MRAKLVNEDLISINHDSENMSIEDMAAEISSLVYTTYNGDDVDYEPNDEDTAEVEQIIKDNVNISELRYVDEDADIDDPLTEDDLDIFGNEEWILDQLSKEDIINLYNAFKQTKFMSYSENDDFDEDKMREDMFDPQDDSERFRSQQPGDHQFDLDQDIYNRNMDYDVDEK